MNNKLESIKNNIRQAIEDYWAHTSGGTDIKDNISESFIQRLAEDSLKAKAPLRNMLRKSPNWNEDLDAVVINSTIDRKKDFDTIRSLTQELLLPAIEKAKSEFNFVHAADIINAGRYFYEEENDDAETESYIASITRLAPRAYSETKKISRIFKSLCDALEVTDETANSNFQRKFAKLADELTVKKLQYKLFLSVNPAHFITMSNPKEDNRGPCLTSCHSFNCDEYDYNNGCTGYARDSVTMIAFTVSDPNCPETLNNRKTTRQLFMYQPDNGLLLQSRMYNTSGGTSGAQTESKVYREVVQEVIATCEDAANRWKTSKYYNNDKNVCLDAASHFGGYADWDYEEFSAMISIRNDHEYNYHNFEIGAAGLCIRCGHITESGDGLYCDHCNNDLNNEERCDCCGEYYPADELYTVYNEDGDRVGVCRSCRDDNYEYCDSCEEWHPSDECHWIESEQVYVCDGCYDEYYEECEDCGEVYRKDDIYSVTNEYGEAARVCERCLNNHYVECEDCNDYVHEEAVAIVYDEHGNEKSVCPDCCEKYYTECEECGKYYPNDIIEEGLCPNCLEETPICQECKEHIPNEDDIIDIYIENNGYNSKVKTICRSCYEDSLEKYKTCKKCGAVCTNEVMSKIEKEGYGTLCPDCLAEAKENATKRDIA